MHTSKNIHKPVQLRKLFSGMNFRTLFHASQYAMPKKLLDHCDQMLPKRQIDSLEIVIALCRRI